MESMLEAQLNSEMYYYNIVTWLDRLLYSPEALREFFYPRSRDAGYLIAGFFSDEGSEV